MSYQKIEALIKNKVSSLSTIEQSARMSAQNFLNALEARLFPQLAPATTPRTLFVMDADGESWKEVQSTQNLMSLHGRLLTFAVGVRFFQGSQAVAKVILPVALKALGGDSEFAFGASFAPSGSSNGGNYLEIAEKAEQLIGQAASTWIYDRRGIETIIVQ